MTIGMLENVYMAIDSAKTVSRLQHIRAYLKNKLAALEINIAVYQELNAEIRKRSEWLKKRRGN